jgi:hypothetical protein
MALAELYREIIDSPHHVTIAAVEGAAGATSGTHTLKPN